MKYLGAVISGKQRQPSRVDRGLDLKKRAQVICDCEIAGQAFDLIDPWEEARPEIDRVQAQYVCDSVGASVKKVVAGIESSGSRVPEGREPAYSSRRCRSIQTCFAALATLAQLVFTRRSGSVTGAGISVQCYSVVPMSSHDQAHGRSWRGWVDPALVYLFGQLSCSPREDRPNEPGTSS